MTPIPVTSVKCDYCGRENVADARQCHECGTTLTTEPVAQPASAISNEVAHNDMFKGALWFIGGVVVTGGTYLAASGPGGGSYFVAWGAILYGAIRFFRGFSARSGQPGPSGGQMSYRVPGQTSVPTPQDTPNDGYAALDFATKLEGQGRVKEAMAAYQKIAETFPNTDLGRDAQKSLESLRKKFI